jgi:GDPmannose 4,6-dehydratase
LKVTRALICGASGQDGAYLAQTLSGKGYEVHGSTRGPASLSPANLTALGVADRVILHSLQPTDADAVVALLDEVRPDEIYYLAAQSSVWRSFEEPLATFQASALGLWTMLDAARRIVPGARILNAASGDCFGETPADAPATENSPFHPRSPYAAAKCAGHHAISVARLADGQFACSAFLFNHESPLRPETFAFGKIIAAIRRIAGGAEEKLRLGDVEVVRDWGWAPDYVEAMWRMLQQDEPGDFVIATGSSHRLADFVALAFAEAGLDWRDHVIVGAVRPRPTDISRQFADPCRAREILGWQAGVSLKELASRLVAS